MALIAAPTVPKISRLIFGVLPQIGYNQPQNSLLTPVFNPR